MNNTHHKEEVHFSIEQCSLGLALIAKSHKGICAIMLGDTAEELISDFQKRFRMFNLVKANKFIAEITKEVINYIEAPKHAFKLPLDIYGTKFQQKTWQALREIPFGTTVSYTDIAKKINLPKAVRAVAQACGANPIAVLIPCHRVLRLDGSLSGYRWGIHRKKILLERELK